MSTLVIKNLPDGLHQRLRERARKNHRSLTKEAIAIIESGVLDSGTPLDANAALEAVFAAGDALQTQGVDLEKWAATSREAWR